MPATYDKIATNTLGSATSTVTFSSIAGTYTDLVLIMNSNSNSGTIDSVMRYNGDTGTNYSWTELQGDGTSATSARFSTQNYIYTMNQYTSSISTSIISIQNYSNTTTNKTALIRNNNAAAYVNAAVGLWRSTAAITSVTLLSTAGSYAAGSTFTLYGIKAA